MFECLSKLIIEGSEALKVKNESNLIPTSKWVINCRADGTAPKAWDKRLPSSVKAAIRELEIEKEKKAKK